MVASEVEVKGVEEGRMERSRKEKRSSRRERSRDEEMEVESMMRDGCRMLVLEWNQNAVN